jgi:hypothetical protein
MAIACGGCWGILAPIDMQRRPSSMLVDGAVGFLDTKTNREEISGDGRLYSLDCCLQTGLLRSTSTLASPVSIRWRAKSRLILPADHIQCAVAAAVRPRIDLFVAENRPAADTPPTMLKIVVWS